MTMKRNRNSVAIYTHTQQSKVILMQIARVLGLNALIYNLVPGL